MKLSMVRRTIYGSRGGWTRRSLVLAAALTAAASPSVAGDVAITPVALFHAAPVPEALRPQAPFSMHVSPGDHIKVAFYERVASLADGRGEQVSSSQLVERTELTGEYVVQLDGTVFVPLLGAIDIGSQSLPEAQHALATVFRSATGPKSLASTPGPVMLPLTTWNISRRSAASMSGARREYPI